MQLNYWFLVSCVDRNSWPINEVMAPNWQPLSEKFNAEFDGMTFENVELENSNSAVV